MSNQIDDFELYRGNRDTKKVDGLLRVANYIRVSTDKQAKEGDSIPAQYAVNTKHIDEHENMILFDTYIDDGVSGQKVERGDFQRLMQDVRDGYIDLIVFTKIDRWFRNLRHYLNTQAVLDEHHVAWTAVTEPWYDTTTPQGEAFINQNITFAQLEAKNTAQRIKTVFDYKVQAGEVISGSLTRGWKIENKHLVQNEDAPKVKLAYEYYRDRQSLYALMKFVADEFNWNMEFKTLKRLLTNTVNKGEYRGNKNYCKPIVSSELFDEVNAILPRNKRHDRVREYIFSGLLFCSECDGRLAGHPRYFNNEGRHYTYSYYRCNKHFTRAVDNCPNNKLISENVIQRQFLDRLRPDLEKYIADYTITAAPAVNYDSKRKHIQNKIKRLKDLYLNELISIEEFKSDKIKFEIMLSEIPDQPPKKKDLSHIQKLLDSDIESIYNEMTISEKNRFLRSFIKKIVVDMKKEIVRIDFL